MNRKTIFLKWDVLINLYFNICNQNNYLHLKFVLQQVTIYQTDFRFNLYSMYNNSIAIDKSVEVNNYRRKVMLKIIIK